MARKPFGNRRSAVGRAANKAAQVVKKVVPKATRPSRRSGGSDQITGIPGQATPLPQQEREDARLGGMIKKKSGPEVVRDSKRLQELLDEGTITGDQFKAARDQLLKGSPGVDPLGFSTGEQIGGINTPRGSTQRAPADAPLRDSRSGAGGRAGALGITPQNFGQRGGFMTFADQQIAELEGKKTNIMTTTKSGRQTIDLKATKQLHDDIDREIRQIEREKQEKIRESQKEQKERETLANASMDTPSAAGGGGFQQSQANIAQIGNLLNKATTDPVFAGSDYAVRLQGLMGNQALTDFESLAVQRFAGLGADDQNNNGVTDAVESSAIRQEQILERQKDQQDEMNKKMFDIAKEAAEISKDMAKYEQQKFEINQQIREQEQREANIENEIRNRRIANKMGITTDTQGLKWMQDEVRKGKEALQRLSEFGDAQRGQFAIQTGRQYTQNINTALLNYDSRQATIDANFSKALQEIEKTISLDAKERQEKKDGIMKDYWDQKAAQDKETRADMRLVYQEMMATKRANDKNMMENIVNDTDAQEYADKIRKEVNDLKLTQSYEDIAEKLTSMKAAQQVFLDAKAEGDTSGKGARDVAVLKLYEKTLDRNSVVREGEVRLQMQSQGISRRVAQGIIDAVKGGSSLDDEQIQAMIDTADAVVAAAREKTIQKMQPQLASIRVFNKRRGTDIQMDQVFTQDVIDAFGGYEDEASELFDAFDTTDDIIPDSNTTVVQQEFATVRDWASNVGSGSIVKGSPFHTGKDKDALDIDGNIGDPIPAFSGGRVISISNDRESGYGVSVVVEEGGKQYLYAHLDSANVRMGQDIVSGQEIGTIGNTGNVLGANGERLSKKQKSQGRGSHLHFRVTQNGNPVAFDPPNTQSLAQGGTESSIVPKASAEGIDELPNIEPQVQLQADQQRVSQQTELTPFDLQNITTEDVQIIVDRGGIPLRDLFTDKGAAMRILLSEAEALGIDPVQHFINISLQR